MSATCKLQQLFRAFKRHTLPPSHFHPRWSSCHEAQRALPTLQSMFDPQKQTENNQTAPYPSPRLHLAVDERVQIKLRSRDRAQTSDSLVEYAYAQVTILLVVKGCGAATERSRRCSGVINQSHSKCQRHKSPIERGTLAWSQATKTVESWLWRPETTAAR